MNLCAFSQNRQYRYSLTHRWDEVQPLPLGAEHSKTEYTGPRLVAWIGLNPSTADENTLDATLRRVKAFSSAWGYDGFVMLNLFAWRDKSPKEMMKVRDPVGHENDTHILKHVALVDRVVCAWGNFGGYLSRVEKVVRLLETTKAEIVCLDRNANGSPKHPLYIQGSAVPQPFTLPKPKR